MTITEAHIEFKIRYDKTDSLNYPNFLPEEIDVFLNNAIEKFIEQRAYGTNAKRLGLEETQKRDDDLRNIIKNSAITPNAATSNNKPHGRFISLPTDYRHAIQEEATVNYIDCTGATASKRVEVIPTTHDRYNRTIKDPFNKPYEDQIIRLIFQGDVFELVSDATTQVTTYHLRYVATPTKVRYGTTYSTPTTDIQFTLAEHCHREIISMAVEMALENVESRRLNTFNNMVKTDE